MSAVARGEKRPARGRKPSVKSSKKLAPKAKRAATPKGGAAEKAAALKNAQKSEAKKLQKRASLRADLLRELSQVRENLASSTQAFMAGLDAELARITCVFEGETIPGEPERLPPVRVQACMLQAIRDLKVKPEKGRLKDLGRLADLGERLARLMPQGG
jgi:hypothetical protein